MNKAIYDNYLKINAQLQSGQILGAKNLLSDLDYGNENIGKLIKIQVMNAEMRYQEAVQITFNSSEYDESLWISVLFLLHQAFAQTKCENIEQAWQLYNLAIKVLENISLSDLEENISFTIVMMKSFSFSSLLWLKGKLDEAIQVLTVLETSIKNINQYQLLYVNIEILFSQIVMQTGNYNLSKQKLVQAKNVAINFDYYAFLADINKQLGIIDLIRGNLETSPQLLLNALEEFQKLDLDVGIAETTHALALVNLHKGNLDKANYFFDIAEPIFKTRNLTKQLSKIFTNRGVLANRYGDLTTAVSYHTKSLGLKQEMNDEIGQSISFFNLGTIQSLQGHYDKALSNYSDALIIQTKLSLNRNIANTKMNIGVAYREKGNPEIALKYFNEALSINEAIGNKNASGRCLQNIASIHSFNSKPEIALQYYQMSLKIRIEVDNKIESADVYFQLIQTCIVLGNLSKACN